MTLFFENWEKRIDRIKRPMAGTFNFATKNEVFFHRERGEQPPTFGHQSNTLFYNFIGGQTCNVLALKKNTTTFIRNKPANRF